jgi:homoserine kinase type II
MAVYSPITEKELLTFLKQYDIGSLIKFEGILEGIENTNYKITTSQNIYILTIFEKRVKLEDLPFFINLKNHLVEKNFFCPKPIANKQGLTICTLNGKKCVLISYLKGSKADKVFDHHCEQVGNVLSSLHQNTADFKEKRVNGMNYIQWQNIFLKCQSANNSKYINLINFIREELEFLKIKWPNNLPKGIIHADVFQDNVFFINNQFSGLIDFYFACNDFLAYDIALTINAWCFDNQNNFVQQRFKSFIKGYEDNRLLTNQEKSSLSILLRGAAIRILLTRLHDKLFHPKGAFVEPKDPQEYVKILQFHQDINMEDYLS